MTDTKTKEIELKGKKKIMFDNLIKTLGNITKSAQITGISRLTHYDWLESDPTYKKYIENIDDYQVDFYETALNQLIQDKNVTATIFALKCKGKKRGWTERSEIELSGGLKNTLNAEDFFNAWEESKKK